MKIPFEIKYRPQIESGEYKVETEAGSPAKVMDWEYNNRVCGKCIAIKITEGDGDHGLLYTHEGKRASIFQAEEGSDLFIITPEPELSEFEQAVAECMYAGCDLEGMIEVGTCIETIKQTATTLLDLARKEIESKIKEEVVHDYWRHTANLQIQAKKEGYNEALKDIEQDPESSYAFKRGVEYGKEEALKDLPRWKKIGRGNNYSSETKFAINGRYLEMNDTLNAVYEVALSDLEKLPGFKED